jgi:S-phase kinase-associated protein 1
MNETENQSLAEISQIDLDFIKVDYKVLFGLILAANYLDIPGLLDLGCKTVANNIKEKSIDEIYTEYEIPLEDRFTPEERVKIEEEIKWASSGTNAL